MGAATKSRTSGSPILDFIQQESTGAIILLASALAGLLWANSVAAPQYFNLIHTKIGIAAGPYHVEHSLQHWLNDGLMVLFFLLVGLEIKRELLVGHLKNVRDAILPSVAALGGMVVPACIYAAVNAGQPSVKGWGIPMATDLAFALGIMFALGKRVPVALKVFLTALAIADDLGSIIAIALFYSSHIDWHALLWAAGILALLAVINKAGVRQISVYLVLGFLLWICVMDSGIHSTIAGVLLAFAIPAKTRIDTPLLVQKARKTLEDLEGGAISEGSVSEPQQESLNRLECLVEGATMPLERLENSLGPWVTYLVIPVFGFANAGVSLAAGSGSLGTPIGLGVMLGLVVGKPLGICLFSWLAIKSKLCRPLRGVRVMQFLATGCLGGIGFTMSLFINELAFAQSVYSQTAKVTILVASLISAIIGASLFVIGAVRRRPNPAPSTSEKPG